MTLIQTEPKKITIRKPSMLPAAYQEVEYIQSSGTQYFIVGTSFKASYKTILDFQITQSGQDYVLVGIYDSYNKYGVNSVSGYLKVANGGNTWSNTASYDTNRHTLTIDNGTVTVDGTNYSVTYGSHTYSKGLGVFGYNTGTDVQDKANMKLYKLDIYDENGVHIYDLVPCYRKADSVNGMYDLVNDQFYTNAGTGTFTKGNDVNLTEKEIKKIVIFPDGVTEKQIRPAPYVFNYDFTTGSIADFATKRGTVPAQISINSNGMTSSNASGTSLPSDIIPDLNTALQNASKIKLIYTWDGTAYPGEHTFSLMYNSTEAIVQYGNFNGASTYVLFKTGGTVLVGGNYNVPSGEYLLTLDVDLIAKTATYNMPGIVSGTGTITDADVASIKQCHKIGLFVSSGSYIKDIKVEIL